MSNSRPPHEYVFYLDECLGGTKIPDALRNAGIKFEIHSDHFQRGTPDQEWLEAVGKRGWIVITQDKGIRRHKAELLALRQNNVCAFIIAARGLRGEQIGELIVKAMPKMLRLLKKTHPPLVAVVQSSNVVELKEGREKYGKK